MTKKGGSLTFPSDPLAAMQELSALDAPAPPAPEEVKQIDQSYDNMTNKLSDKPADTLTVKQDDLHTAKKADKVVRKKVSQEVGQEESQPAGPTVAQLIRRRAGTEAAKEVLKTVTLKISPTLDERIERYCFENKIKKQDFWAEAAALYFETVEEEQG